MKPTAFVINTSRGPVIDEAALVAGPEGEEDRGRGPRRRRARAAGFARTCQQMPNVVLTPHLGSAVLSLREGMANVVVDNTIALIEGREPVSCLNPHVLKKLFGFSFQTGRR